MTENATPERDPHCGPVPDEAWARDAETRRTGRVEIFNATRPGGLDNWTMDADQYQAVHDLILEIIDHDAAKTDMEARCEIERIPRSSPQCITRWLPVSHVAGSEVT